MGVMVEGKRLKQLRIKRGIVLRKIGFGNRAFVTEDKLLKSLIPQQCWGEWSKQERAR